MFELLRICLSGRLARGADRGLIGIVGNHVAWAPQGGTEGARCTTLRLGRPGVGRFGFSGRDGHHDDDQRRAPSRGVGRECRKARHGYAVVNPVTRSIASYPGRTLRMELSVRRTLAPVTGRSARSASRDLEVTFTAGNLTP